MELECVKMILKEYEKMGFDKPQLYQMMEGLIADLDISIYAKHEYNYLQMQEIRLGLRDNLNVTLYTNSKLEPSKMCDIRLYLLTRKVAGLNEY